MITLIFWIAVAGVLTYLLVTYLPMPAAFKAIIIALVSIALIAYVLNFFGVNVGFPMGKLK